MSNFVFIATSIDGYIARKDGTLDWLTKYENQEGTDYGYSEFIDSIDAHIIGRYTYETVASFSKWFYTKPVYVLSSSLPPQSKPNNVQFVNEKPKDLVQRLRSEGFNNFYIDGGKTIQSFLKENLLDEITITRVPIILGSGIPLFSSIDIEIKFSHVKTTSYSNGLVKTHYKRF